jgi:hypothetical protein
VDWVNFVLLFTTMDFTCDGDEIQAILDKLYSDVKGFAPDFTSPCVSFPEK